MLAKLSPDVTDIVAVARACADAGADGLTLVNTLLGLVIDPDTMRPVLGGVTGGLSGPAILPVALRCVWQVHAALPSVPILGVGGIRTGLDALQFVLAGASAVSVGTAVFGDPSAPVRVLAELETALAERGFTAVADAIGYAHRDAGVELVEPPPPAPVTDPAQPCRWWPGPGRAGGSARRTSVTRPAFGGRLDAAVAARGPLVVGIDPHLPLLRDWGLPDDVSGLERFALTAVEAVADRVAVVKPQSAFFERFGSRGIAVLERVLAAIRAAGALSLLDVKRGDIGSTMAGYAGAYLDPASPLAADAITASPYLGFGSLRPLLDAAYANGRGVFVLALTSNPEGPAVQRAVAADGRTVAQADPRPGRGGQRGRGRPARVGRRGRRRHRRRARPPAGPPARSGARPGPRRAGRGAGRPARGVRTRRCPWCCRRCPGRCSAPGPIRFGFAPRPTGSRPKSWRFGHQHWPDRADSRCYGPGTLPVRPPAR